MNGYNNLVRRNHTYYIRVRIPFNLQYLLKRKEFKYSLKTNDYQIARDNLYKEGYKIKLVITLLKRFDMEIKNKTLILDDVDIDKFIIYQLKKIESYFEDRYEDIVNKQTDFNSLMIFNRQESEKNTLKNCFEEYLKDLRTDKRQPASVVKFVDRVYCQNIPIISLENSKPPEWIEKTITGLKGVEKYTKDKLECIVNDIEFNKGLNPRVKRCLSVINTEKEQAALKQSNTKTTWKRVFEDFRQYKNQAKQTGENTIQQNYSCLETVFELIGKKYVENITYKDCQKVSSLIHKVPIRWKDKYPNKKLLDIIEMNNANTLSTTSIRKYLIALKEFLRFCKKRRLIAESFNEDFDLPIKKNQTKINGFEKEDLKTIFTPAKYPRETNSYYGYRYWIPLIALYTGMRLNEICQLYVDDIKYTNNVWYFDLTDIRPDQHLKNKQSKRQVPIHPILIELGLLNYRELARKNEKDRIFYQIVYSPKNHYAAKISGWFGRYLNSIGIKDKSKVFHSFRHTFKPALRDSGVPKEYQNAICGWSADDIGEEVYGGNIPIERLHQEISKVSYPFLDKIFKELKILNKKEG